MGFTTAVGGLLNYAMLAKKLGKVPPEGPIAFSKLALELMAYIVNPIEAAKIRARGRTKPELEALRRYTADPTQLRPYLALTLMAAAFNWSDEEALALGPDAETCALPRDARENARAIDSCLALAVAAPVPRWVALDGFAAQKVRDAERRGRGLAVALGGVAIAVLLEGALLLRAAALGRLVVDGVAASGRRWTVAVAILTGLLGFALLAAFLVRLS